MGLSSGAKWLSRKRRRGAASVLRLTPRASVLLCYTWEGAPTSPPPPTLRRDASLLKFSRRSGRGRLPLLLIRFSPDNLGESATSVSALPHISASEPRPPRPQDSSAGDGRPLTPVPHRRDYHRVRHRLCSPLAGGVGGGRWAVRAFNEILTLALRAAVDI